MAFRCEPQREPRKPPAVLAATPPILARVLAVADRSHLMPRGLQLLWRIPCRTPAPPLTRNLLRRSLDAQGRPLAGGPSGPRHFFGFFASCAAREQREKLPSGDFNFHARLRFLPLPACPRCMRLARREARHRGGPPSLRSSLFLRCRIYDEAVLSIASDLALLLISERSVGKRKVS